MRECNQCGKCCLKYGDALVATAQEVSWWEVARPHIAQYVSGGEIWMDPTSGERLPRCPWLREGLQEGLQEIEGTRQLQYQCSIYEDRPDDCRQYPTTLSEMVRDECEMIEVRDLTDTAKAQRQLDKIMAESRPAVE